MARSRSRPVTGPRPRRSKNTRDRRSPSSPSLAICSPTRALIRRSAASRGCRCGPELGVQRLPVRLQRARDQRQPVGQPGQPPLVGMRPRDDHQQPQVAAVPPQLLRLRQHLRPVDRDRHLRDRPVALVPHHLDAGLHQPLDLVKARVIAQAHPRGVRSRLPARAREKDLTKPYLRRCGYNPSILPRIPLSRKRLADAARAGPATAASRGAGWRSTGSAPTRPPAPRRAPPRRPPPTRSSAAARRTAAGRCGRR